LYGKIVYKTTSFKTSNIASSLQRPETNFVGFSGKLLSCLAFNQAQKIGFFSNYFTFTSVKKLAIPLTI
jgi:hypothetical protein